MRDLDHVLLVPLAHVRLLLPGVILAYAQHAYALFPLHINNSLAGSVHVVIDTPVPLVGHALHTPRCTRVTELLL
jgi:hypothetical protein